MRYEKSEKPITTSHPDLGDLELDGVEVPQYDNFAEFSQAAGGDETAMEWINGKVEDAAKSVGRVALRNLPKGADLKLSFAKILDAIKNYSPKGGERATTVNKKKAAAFDQIEQLISGGSNVTLEQLQALLAQAK